MSVRHICEMRCHACPDCGGETMPWCWGTPASGDIEDCICPDNEAEVGRHTVKALSQEVWSGEDWRERTDNRINAKPSLRLVSAANSGSSQEADQ